MKLTKTKLKQLIKEELDNALLDELGPNTDTQTDNIMKELASIRKLLKDLPAQIVSLLVGLPGKEPLVPMPQGQRKPDMW